MLTDAENAGDSNPCRWTGPGRSRSHHADAGNTISAPSITVILGTMA